jgi:hypothetical protein
MRVGMSKKSFVADVYTPKYSSRLGKRSETFKAIFDYLESLKQDYYIILETGCCRIADNYAGDGMSTILFDDFVNFYDGHVYSFDITQQHVDLAKASVSSKTSITCADSVKSLFDLSKDTNFPKIDLCYLDSFDIDFANPHPSSMHHVKEFMAIQPKLKTGTLVAIDDHAHGVGKGMYIEEYMKEIGIQPFFHDYQIGWIIELIN